ncbi:MAG: hypothetical protein ABEK17_00540 [Candidatus Aenigmatarchaeota archaeon]
MVNEIGNDWNFFDDGDRGAHLPHPEDGENCISYITFLRSNENEKYRMKYRIDIDRAEGEGVGRFKDFGDSRLKSSYKREMEFELTENELMKLTKEIFDSGFKNFDHLYGMTFEDVPERFKTNKGWKGESIYLPRNVNELLAVKWLEGVDYRTETGPRRKKVFFENGVYPNEYIVDVFKKIRNYVIESGEKQHGEKMLKENPNGRQLRNDMESIQELGIEQKR